jgi:hypothetical protein
MVNEERPYTYFHYVSANVQHRNAAKGGAPEQTFPAADFLDNVERERAHPKRLRNTVKSSREELGRGTRNAKSFEDPWRIVGDDILETQVSRLR